LLGDIIYCQKWQWPEQKRTSGRNKSTRRGLYLSDDLTLARV